MNPLLLIKSAQYSEMDEALLRLAGWMGLETQVITLSDRPLSIDDSPQGSRLDETCVALSADTLVLLLKSFGAGLDFNRLFPEQSLRCLVYGFKNFPSHTDLLRSLLNSNSSGLKPLPEGPRRFCFTAQHESWLAPLCGLDYLTEFGDACDAFYLTPSALAQCAPILSADERPIFMRSSTVPGKDFFLWATRRIADVGAPLPQATTLEGIYQWLLPAIIFLKATFGSRCWHNPYGRARLIIDDPLLHPRYGFLRYDALLESMRRVLYGTSIAFIPWNYRRSRRTIANLFIENAHCLSLCIHGCDHTNHEFDCNNEQHLTQKANLALHRMRQHQQSSGVLHENIMVFPQGHFSLEAIRALRQSGFLAVVNSSCSPAHSGGTVTLGDLLLPAVCRFNGFPIFPRRDPTSIFDVAVDLFLGKCAFIVEHHEFVRDGYDKWEQFAKQMNGLDERLVWPPLVDTITQTCLQKLVGEDRIDVRFFTGVFKWYNVSNRPVQAHFSKFDPERSFIEEILVDEKVIPFQVKDGFIHFERIVPPRTAISVNVIDQTMPSGLPLKSNLGEVVRAGLRRYLSEFRDNTLVRYPLLLGCARTAVHYFKLTSHSR